jgi:hypothetical protein
MTNAGRPIELAGHHFSFCFETGGFLLPGDEWLLY